MTMRRVLTVACLFAGATALWMLVQAARFMPDGAYLYVRPWCTVAASVALLVGAGAGLRGRTWGVLLAAVSGMSFLGAWAVGIAPPEYIGIALAGFAPMLAVSPRLFGFDAKAATVAVALAVAIGAAAALAAGPGLDALLS